MHTFVIRLYNANRGAVQDSGGLRGVVEEISTGSETTFQSTEELLWLLGRRRPELSGVSAQGRD